MNNSNLGTGEQIMKTFFANRCYENAIKYDCLDQAISITIKEFLGIFTFNDVFFSFLFSLFSFSSERWIE